MKDEFSETFDEEKERIFSETFAESVKKILDKVYSSDKKIIDLLEEEKKEGKSDLQNNLKEWDLRHGGDYINGGINRNIKNYKFSEKKKKNISDSLKLYNMKKKGLA
jgi:hypothetical protein